MNRPLLALFGLALSLFAGIENTRAADDNLPPPIAELKALIRAGQTDNAIARGETLTSERPDDPVAWLWLGRAYGQQAIKASVFGKPKWGGKCQQALEKSVALDGANLDSRFELLQFYAVVPGMFGGGRDKAEAQRLAIAKLDAGAAHIASGFFAQMDKDIAKAEQEFRTAVAEAHDQRRARLALGQLLIREKRWADARAFWQGILDHNPEDPQAVYMLGRVEAVSGENPAAGLAYIDRYLAMANKDSEIGEAPAYWRRGLLLEKLGRKDEAINALRKSVALDAANEDARKDLQRLAG